MIIVTGATGHLGHAIAYAVEQPADVDVNEIVVRPSAQKY